MTKVNQQQLTLEITVLELCDKILIQNIHEKTTPTCRLDQIMDHLNKQQLNGFRGPGGVRESEVVTESDYSDEERDTFNSEPLNTQAMSQKQPLARKATAKRQASFNKGTVMLITS